MTIHDLCQKSFDIMNRYKTFMYKLSDKLNFGMSYLELNPSKLFTKKNPHLVHREKDGAKIVYRARRHGMITDYSATLTYRQSSTEYRLNYNYVEIDGLSFWQLIGDQYITNAPTPHCLREGKQDTCDMIIACREYIYEVSITFRDEIRTIVQTINRQRDGQIYGISSTVTVGKLREEFSAGYYGDRLISATLDILEENVYWATVQFASKGWPHLKECEISSIHNAEELHDDLNGIVVQIYDKGGKDEYQTFYIPDMRPIFTKVMSCDGKTSVDLQFSNHTLLIKPLWFGLTAIRDSDSFWTRYYFPSKYRLLKG